jgi:broad specificity phosphatase PhoE
MGSGSGSLIYLVRHGEAAAHWSEETDAGLSSLGSQQAAAVAASLAGRGPSTIFSSPLRRARETAAPLENLWRAPARVEAAVAEIPTQGVALAERSSWLNGLLQRGWEGADASSRQWRENVLSFVMGLESDAVVFTHFVAINAVLGAALGRKEVYLFRPANASITVIEKKDGRLRVIEQGVEVTL